MSDADPRRSFGLLARKIIVGILAIIGFLSLVGPTACKAVRPLMYSEQKFPPTKAPTGSLEAYRTITTGGWGTVLTTRVILVDSKSKQEQLIYEAGDSGYAPVLRWLDGETLLLELHCERVDHLSNPLDWRQGRTPMQRVAVRFSYLEQCDQKSEEEGQ